MRYLIALASLLLTVDSLAQTCPTPPADPVPRDQARLSWVRPTTNSDGSALAASVVLTYTLYERVGTTDTARCTTSAVTAGQTGLSDGAHTWVVTARVGTGPESVKSTAASKTIPPAPVVPPGPPTNITVASTRIDPDSWTCRDENGAVLSRHERQDKAQESCTNFAIANLGKTFEMRPSGFRIVAR